MPPILHNVPMKIEKLMQRGIQTCAPGDNLASAAQVLWEKDCGSAPVVDAEGRLVGVITDRDICMSAFFKASRLDQVRVADAMSKQVVQAQPKESLKAAVERMCAARVRRLPVVDGTGVLVGMLTLADLAKSRTSRAAAAKVLAAVSSRPEPAAEALPVMELKPRRATSARAKAPVAEPRSRRASARRRG